MMEQFIVATPSLIDEVYAPIIWNSLTTEEVRNEPIWFVNLNNGTKAYQKHGRRSWLELKQWLKEHPGVWIENLYLQFRDNFFHIASNKEAFFFSYGAQAWQGCPTQHTFIGGYVENDILFRKKFIMPELVHQEEFDDCYHCEHPEIQRGLIRRASK
jgi:hypothetical protein